MSETTPKRRHSPLHDIPHLQASDVRTIDVPARPGLAAHRDYLVTTACGQEKPTTLVTRMAEKVHCAACREAQEG